MSQIWMKQTHSDHFNTYSRAAVGWQAKVPCGAKFGTCTPDCDLQSFRFHQSYETSKHEPVVLESFGLLPCKCAWIRLSVSTSLLE